MNVLNTIWMWGLLAIGVPLIIHLLSKKEGRIIDVGSTRHLQESPTAQFRSIRLNEILLFVLRSLLIALIVLFLAELTLKDFGGASRWIVVEKGLEENSRVKALTDSLENFEVRYLANDFPSINDPSHIPQIKSYWPLLEKLSQSRLDSAIVIAFGHAEKFKGARVPISPKIQWITIDSQPKENFYHVAQLGKDSVLLRKAILVGNNLNLTTEKRRESPPSTLIGDPILVDVVSDNRNNSKARLLAASLYAIADQTGAPLVINARRPGDGVVDASTWVIWLSEEKAAKATAKTIGFATCDADELDITDGFNATEMCAELSDNFDFYVIGPFDQENILKSAFVQKLSMVLLPQQYRPLDLDQRVLNESFLRSGNKFVDHTDESSLPGQAASSWLVFAIATIFILERVISFKRKQ